MKKPLTDPDIAPDCRYCARGRDGGAPGAILCEVRGVTEAGASCRKFEYDPLRRVPRGKPSLPQVDPEAFKL